MKKGKREVGIEREKMSKGKRYMQSVLLREREKEREKKRERDIVYTII